METTTEKPDHQVAAETLAQRLTDLGVTIDAYPSPDPERKMFRFSVIVSKNGRKVLDTFYSMGTGYAIDSRTGKHFPQRDWRLSDFDDAVRGALATGRPVPYADSIFRKLQWPTPSVTDVLSSLLNDADVLNHSSFEEWASSFGYDTDSRKAESIYRRCLEIALTLRAALGDAVVTELQELAQRM